MFAEITLKIFSDCLIFFALLGSCPTLLPYSYPLAIAALICGLAAGLATALSNKLKFKLSRLCAVLPLLSLLLADGWREMLILAPAIIYTGAVILRGRLYLEYFGFRRYFVRSLILLSAMWAAVSLCNYIEDPQGLTEKLVQPGSILRYGFVHFICGIVLQRQLRLGTQKDSRAQLVGVLSGTGAVVFGFTLAEPMLRNSLVSLVRTAFTILIIPVTAVYEVVVRVIMAMIQDVQNDERYQEELENSEGVLSGTYNDYQELMQKLLEDAPESDTSVLAFYFLLLGVIAAVILMFFVFSRARKNTGQMASTKLDDVPRRERPLFSLSPRARVRQAYRDFLMQEKKRGVKLKKHYTTEEILRNLSQNTDKSAASDLRRIYLRARYDETREVSRKDADAARAAARRVHGK